MSMAYWCVLITAFLPLVCAGIAKVGRRDFDNHTPRAWLNTLQGYRQRADFAQRNHFEAFPFFAAAVIIAHQLGAPSERLDLLAIGYVGLRVLYSILYIANWAKLRSLVWAMALALNVWIFVLGQ